jgi:polyisoprenyl-teichoic acid--peptidoglycan teichoic acid transferase
MEARQMNRITHYAMAGISLLLCFVVGTTVLVVNSLAAPIPTLPGQDPEKIVRLTPPQPNEKINLLMIGVDEGLLPGGIRSNTRSDTMMLASFDPKTSAMNVVSIPRDSRVNMPGRKRADKMGHAHAYGGVSLVVDTLELLLDVPIHYYVRVDHSAFRRLIDAIGAVDYYVEKDMFYEDPYQDLYIDLKKGQQKLNGDKAEQYVRYRGDGSDIDRIGRQQKFLMAAIRQALKPTNLLKVNSLVDIAMRSVYTNIDSSDVLKFLPYLDGFSDTKVSTYVLPGENVVIDGTWFWELDRAAMDAILAEALWDDLQGDPSLVRVKIVDATGSDQAESIIRRFTRRGFTVVDVETADATSAKTSITAHDGNDPAALMVFRFIKSGDLFSEVPVVGADYEYDVTLVLGEDL